MLCKLILSWPFELELVLQNFEYCKTCEKEKTSEQVKL